MMKFFIKSNRLLNPGILPYALAAAIAFTAILIFSVWWNWSRIDRAAVESARIQARSNFIKDVIYRRWNSSHGGVYAPITQRTAPNPYLETAERDIQTPSKIRLTKINPAYMTRQAFELGLKDFGLRGHITSINPIRPENEADPWEKKALKSFENGQKEVSSLERMDDHDYLRLMRPLLTEVSCLKCHAKQGYKLNDIRGGISVSVPMAPLYALARERKIHLGWGHGLIWLLGMVTLVFAAAHLNRNQRKRFQAEVALRDAYAGLEEEVAARTAELKMANEALQTQIDERSQAERALQQNAMRLQLAIKAGNVGLWDWDLHTNTVFYSCELKKLIGYGDAEISNDISEWLNRVHPDDLNELMQMINKFMKKPRPDYQMEYRLRHKDGSYRWIMAQAALIHDDTGQAIRMLGSHVDITELKTAEEKLRRHQHHLATAQRIAKLGSWEFDIALKTVSWSDEMYRITGFDSAQGPPSLDQLAEFLHPRDRSIPAQMHEQVLMTGGPEQCEFRSNPNRGAVKYLLYRAEAVKNGKDRPTILVGTLQDVTERKKAIAALESEKKKFEALIDESPFAVALIGPNQQYEYLNPGFELFFGYTLDDVPTRDAWFFKAYPDPLYRDKVIASWDKSRQDANPGTIRSQAWTIRCKDGSDKIVQISTTFLATGQSIIIYEDVTEHRYLEERLRQAQKMEAIGTLAGGIAHDFNNILSAIIGFSELVKSDVPPDSATMENIDEVLKAGLRAKNLVQHILAFSRQTKPEKIPLAMHLVVKETLSLLRATIPTTVEINQKIMPSGMILGDADQIHQVVMNLCTNAFQAMPNEEGLLTIGLRSVDLDAESITEYPELSPGSYIQLSVGDTGMGMSSDIMARIFDPYFTTKPQGQGTGLGLSVIHGIVKTHGGTITVYSEPEKGSTFNVYLPLIDIHQEHKIQAIEMPPPSGTERILFVDDEPALADLGKKMLGSLGYQVVTRTSAQEALKLVSGDPLTFDLVITDMTMPQMTGVDLAGKLLQMHAQLPIILCTGFSHTISKIRAKEIGIREFVMKPLIRRDLADLVRKVLDERVVERQV